MLFLTVEQLMAQTTINPDSVCVGSTSETYWVPSNPNSTYQWIVDPITGGNIISGQGTNSIVIDWSTTSVGLYTSAITLIETDNQTSCSGNTSIDVEVIDLPTNIQSVSVTACEGGNIPDLFVLGGTPSSQFMWYSDSGLNNFLGTGTSFSTNQTTVGVYTYYVVEILNGCSGLPVPATLTIDPAPIVNAGSSGNLKIDSSFNNDSIQIASVTKIALGQTFVSGKADADVKKYSGDIIYIDNKSPVTGSSSQKEEVKIVIEF